MIYTRPSTRAMAYPVIVLTLVLGLVLAACGGQPATGGATPGGDKATPPAAAGAHTTSSGFVCPEPKTKMDVTSKELNLFVWAEYIPQDIIDCFQMIYGVKVNRDEYASNEEMYAKLSKGGANYDIVQPSDYIVALLVRQNLLQKFDKSKLAILDNYNPSYMKISSDPNNDYTLPYETGTYGIAYNTDKVKTAPKAWADLWKPEYAGHMVFLDDLRATIGLTLLTLGYDLNSKDPAQLAQAKTKLAELVKGIKIFDSDSPKTPLIAGDVDLGMIWTGDAVLAQREVPTIQYVYPSEGTITWQDNYAIPKTAPHLDAAYAWLNYDLQADVFWLMLRDYPYSNPNQAALDYAKTSQVVVKDADGKETTAAKLYETYEASPITNTPADVLKAAHHIQDLGEAAPLYDKLWTEVKGQ